MKGLCSNTNIQKKKVEILGKFTISIQRQVFFEKQREREKIWKRVSQTGTIQIQEKS